MDRRSRKEDGRFRALVALAAFDPHNQRWKRAARDAVGPLLAAEPLHVAVWSKGLAEVRNFLMTPLQEIFHDRKRPNEGRTAATVLRQYAADRPDVLADLLLDADLQQFPLLLPALRRHGAQAVALLQRQASGGRKPPVEERTGGLRPPLAVVEDIDRAAGLVTERFALCQALPLERFAEVADSLRSAGYRPVRFRPYAAGRELLVAAVWLRDGRDWQMARGLTAERLKQQDSSWRGKDYVPADIAGWVVDGCLVFGALWVKPASKDEEARLYAGVTYDEHVAAQNEWKDKGYIPYTLQATAGPDGKPRYSGVWGKAAALPKNWNVNWDMNEPAYREALADLSRQPVDVSLYRSAAAAPPRTAAEQLAEAEKAVRDKPGDGPALYRRALAYLRAGRDEKALADLDATVKKYPRFADGYRYRALARARLGRAAGARTDLAAFLKFDGKLNSKLYGEAVVTAYLGEDGPAAKRLEEGIAQRQTDAAFLYDAACALTVMARAVAHRARVESGAAVMAGWGSPVALLAVPVRLEDIARQHRQRQQAYVSRALAVLRQAVDAGYDDFAHLGADEDLEELHGRPEFQALLRRGHLERRYASVRHALTDTEATELHGLDLAKHLRRCRELAAQGYRPVALSVISSERRGSSPPSDRRDQPGGSPSPLVAASVWHRPLLSEQERDRLARRQANAAVALLHLGQPERVWPLFKNSAYPDARTHLLHRAGWLNADPQLLTERLKVETDASARQALILALGEYSTEQLPASLRQQWTAQLLKWYREDSDPGVHAAIDWLLRQGKDGPLPRKHVWGQAGELQKVDAALASRERQRPEGRRWYVNDQGQTMVVFPGPVEFLMGSPLHEAGRYDDEVLHRQRIGRSFALASKKVTVAQFRAFRKAHPEVEHFYTKDYSPDDDGPIISVTWYEAAQYCRWLSEQEGVPEEQMCYPSVADIEKCKDGVTPLKLPADYLSRTGYRLPTEAEWEYACRAGTRTSRSYGSSEEMLAHHAWYVRNSEDRAWPVGQKKPNAFGLFDMHGNTWDWCQESGWPYKAGARGKPAEDEEDKRDITDRLSRVLRGGAFSFLSRIVRSSKRFSDRPSFRDAAVGLRVARTRP